MIFNKIKRQAIDTVPFARLTGIEAVEVEKGRGVAKLKEREELLNHVGTLHAAAQFALGEAASGLAMAGTFAEVITNVRPLASEAQITYIKSARGGLTAHAMTTRPAEELISDLQRSKKIRFDITVDLVNHSGEVVTKMIVEWHVKLIE